MRILSVATLAISLMLVGTGAFLFTEPAVAKSKTTVKMSPEYTRYKKASGKTDINTAPLDTASGKAPSSPALLRGNNSNDRKGGRY